MSITFSHKNTLKNKLSLSATKDNYFGLLENDNVFIKDFTEQLPDIIKSYLNEKLSKSYRPDYDLNVKILVEDKSFTDYIAYRIIEDFSDIFKINYRDVKLNIEDLRKALFNSPVIRKILSTMRKHTKDNTWVIFKNDGIYVLSKKYNFNENPEGNTIPEEMTMEERLIALQKLNKLEDIIKSLSVEDFVKLKENQ